MVGLRLWCGAPDGSQLEPGYHRFDSKVQVDAEGYKEQVTIEDIPGRAPDFGACMRNVLRDMPIADEPFRRGVETLKYQRAHSSPEQSSLVGHPAVIVVAGVTIVVSELVLEAGATTILFSVTVEVIDKAAKDVAELAKRGFKKCMSHYTGCMATGLSNPFRGNHWSASHCNGCFERCQIDGVWPDAVGGKTCVYW